MMPMPINASERPRIGYVVSRFPKLSETFILREMEALENLGWHVDVFPFMRMADSEHQPGVDRWLRRLGAPDTLVAVVLAHLVWLAHAPGRLCSLYLLVLRALWPQPAELLRSLVAIARGTVWARQAQQRGIVHVHAHFARHPVVAALTVSHLAGVSFSFTGHSHDIYRYPALLAEKVRRARFVVVVSHLLRERYVAPRIPSSMAAKVVVIRCGVPIARYPLRAAPPVFQPLVVLTVARLVEVKGLAVLIEACALLKQQGRVLTCRIIGEGPLRARLEAQSQALGVADCVEFLGACSQAVVRQELEAASLFVLPSIVMADGTVEGVPVSLMEAMAIGVPVVATRTGAIPELLEDGKTGLLVNPGNAAALAAAIARLPSDPGLVQHLIAGARLRVESEFDLEKTAAKLDHQLRLAVAAAGQETPCRPPVRPPDRGGAHNARYRDHVELLPDKNGV